MFIKKLFRKKQPKLKKTLIISQQQEKVSIKGQLNSSNYQITKLLLEERGSGNRIYIDNKSQENIFLFEFDLTQHISMTHETNFDIYVNVQVNERFLTNKQIEVNSTNAKMLLEDDNTKTYEYPIRLGRFAETITGNIEEYINGEQSCLLYKTVKGNISLSVNKEVNQKYISQINYLKSKQNYINFGGKLFTRTQEIEELDLLIIGRDSNLEYSTPIDFIHLKAETIKKFGLNRYMFTVDVNLNDMVNKSVLTDDVYDLFFHVKFKNSEEKALIRVGKPRFRARYNIKSSNASTKETTFAVSPYFTFRLFNLSFQVDSFEKDTFQYLKQITRWSFFHRLFNKSKDIWLVGERPYKAQDTGFAYFKYMRENYPEKNIYYVIDKDSPELENVLPLGNVIYHKTKEHIKKTIIATRIIGSHHADYLYPLRTIEFGSKVKGKKVFLQHGVMGTKNMIANYGKGVPSFKTDLFLVSSEFEREMIVNDFGYRPNEVEVTGLSRFDSLFVKNVPEKRQLLIIPTWREWLVREDQFLESEYFERYLSLVNSEKIHEIVEGSNLEIVLCLHPNMQSFSDYFKNDRVRIIHQGEIDVQSLLKESTMMITDYSSVAFDFSFLNKPIIYYQFDRNRFIGKKESHLDLDRHLPGDIVSSEEEIYPLLNGYITTNFTMKEEYQKRANRFIEHKDNHSSERIYQAINNLRRKSIKDRLLDYHLTMAIFNRFRRSSRYFPTMKKYYKFAKRLLPVDNNLIVFESGIGKQYADSPRYVYEEMIKRGLDYKYIWVCNKNIRFNDLNTRKIKRLSPQYYYYLAKAKLWVNNQNFPTYIEKRHETTYLQTWHGTPLKKMLNDIENITGRTDDYLERVTNATRSWDYLISPSKYATKAFRSAFKYEVEVLEVGYPRNDLFFKDNYLEKQEEIRKKLNIKSDIKIILYAPTFRDNETTGKNKFLFNMAMDLKKMQEALSDEYVILMRTHVIVKNKFKISEELDNFVIDVSSYSEVQELLLITDILMTDYSSVMFDFANTDRPMLFFTYDFETYRDEVRGFYMDFENEAPGPLVRDTDQIIDSILHIDEVKTTYAEKYASFKERFCSLEDGQASTRVVDELLKKQTFK